MPYNGYTEARKRANLKYLKEKTDDIRIRTMKGTKNRWKHFGELSGKSMTAYVLDAVDRQIVYDESGQNELDPEILPNLIHWLMNHGHSYEEILDCLTSLGNPPDSSS